MLKNEIEENAKFKIQNKVNILPDFLHSFFLENNATAFTTKINYLNVLKHFLSYIMNMHHLKSVQEITIYEFENLTLNNVIDYKNGLLKSYSEHTVFTRINSLKGIYKYLYYNNIISKDIMSQIIVNKVTNDKINKNKNIAELLENIQSVEDDFFRIRNLSIVTLIIDTGFSVQNIIELNQSNFKNDRIIYQDGCNIIQYILKPKTIKYLKQYLSSINKSMELNDIPLYLSRLGNRISTGALKNIFTQYGTNISPSDLQRSVHISIGKNLKYTMTVESTDLAEESIE